MRACRNASIVFFAVALPMIAFGACRDPERPEVPPVTSSTTPESAPPGDSIVDAAAPPASPVRAKFIEGPTDAFKFPGYCSRVLVAALRAPVTVTAGQGDPAQVKDTLSPGDVGVYASARAVEVKTGFALVATMSPPCETSEPPAFTHAIVKASAAPEIKFAKGAMSAHLDVGAKLSPELYLGRLEGTAAVPEHDHANSWEILAAVEASGTFTLAGVEQHLGPKQIVMVPPGTKHSWKPDPGSKLVAIQMYTPPGPEQRFVALAAAEKDAGRDANAK